MSAPHEESRVKQVAVAAGILLVLTVGVCGALIGWRYLPGLTGEWIGMMVGVMTSPFFMEASFILIGLTLVVAINHWRQQRAGDDFVDLQSFEKPTENPAASSPSEALKQEAKK